MLYLVTGANGTGKTLLTLKHVKEMADKEARPVCYNGRFDLNPNGPLANWKKIDIKDWQAEPDGTIFFVDECHNDFPTRGTGAPVPEYVRMLAEHRKRGFDFFLITQHPQNIDVFVRRLIGNPGWHRHLKRVAGASLVSQLQWDAVNPQCERPGSGESGVVTMVGYPKEVYTWYQSAELHTAKRKIPRPVFVLVGCALLAPVLGWYALHGVYRNVAGKALGQAAASAPGASGATRTPGAAVRAAKPAGPSTAEDYAVASIPRFAGLPWTAPKYDQVTQPVEAPYPAACIEGVRPGHGASTPGCVCFTQQATVIAGMPLEVCHQIAQGGFFMDWKGPGAQPGQAVAASSPASAPVAAAAPLPSAAVIPAAAASSARLLSAPGDTAPKVFPAVADAGAVYLEPVSPDVQRTGAAVGAMRRGQRAW